MKNSDFEPRIVRLRFSDPGDGGRVWEAMKIAAKAALGLGAFWLLASFIIS
jgi:hypothetical protein